MLSLAVAGATAFTPSSQLPGSQCAVHARTATPHCSLLNEESMSRRALVSGGAGLALGLGVTPAWAGYVTSLGIETTKPKDAEKDEELLASSAVKKSLDGIKKYKSSASTLKSKFSGDVNMQLIPTIRKEFDFGQVGRSRRGREREAAPPLRASTASSMPAVLE